jgi:endonuclease/exonuclease/phosphatase family metal-dependent hydrolase
MIATVLLLLGFGALFLVNRWNRPPAGRISVQNADGGRDAGSQITVTGWNIGYAALGAKADLFIDGGHSLRALARDDIQIAAENISEKLAELQSDIVLLQEDARPGFLTRGVDVHGAISRGLDDYSRCFIADFRTFLIPKPLNINHGTAVFSKLRPSDYFTLAMPQDPLYYYGFLKKYYGASVHKYPRQGHGDWVVINIHLSAFDETARKNQLAALFDFAVAEYEAGNHVIIGGDWNMTLSASEFSKSELPKGWSLGVDSRVPSLRATNAPYIKGETRTFSVDGFIVSPNVRVDTVITHDLGFEHTDHHPVSARFSIIV